MMLIFINLKLLITIEYTSITLYITEYKLLIDKASKNQITSVQIANYNHNYFVGQDKARHI
jgi:hypothetical protein